jgi:hypothetical protein
LKTTVAEETKASTEETLASKDPRDTTTAVRQTAISGLTTTQDTTETSNNSRDTKNSKYKFSSWDSTKCQQQQEHH